ncbi:hypothetical protein V5799_020299 [Amblyomma americanum]|uniref:Uncharacterized protein n=1 Tax=Amblyomma americanum TaxID=6943 RepID=A0AAQ4EU83_AMBAM
MKGNGLNRNKHDNQYRELELRCPNANHLHLTHCNIAQRLQKCCLLDNVFLLLHAGAISPDMPLPDESGFWDAPSTPRSYLPHRILCTDRARPLRPSDFPGTSSGDSNSSQRESSSEDTSTDTSSSSSSE